MTAKTQTIKKQKPPRPSDTKQHAEAWAIVVGMLPAGARLS